LPCSADGARRRALEAEARAAFERALATDPSDGRGYLGLARAHAKAGRTAEARAWLEEGTRATRGENAFLWQAWAVLEERCGDVAAARRLYDAATVADKRHAAAWHGWGMLEKRQGNFQRARDLLTTGLRLVPDSAPKEFLFQSLGVMCAERGRADDARRYFSDGARTESGRRSPALWQAWARLEAGCGRADKARALFQRALAASPKNRHTWLAWATLEAGLGAVPRARELYRQGASLNPRDPALMQAWARMEAGCGRLPAARALFERAARVAPGHQPVWQAWGCAEAAAGETAAARLLFQRGVWAAPDSRDAARCFQAWGCLEEREGKPGLARQLFRAALRVDPASAPTWQAWARLEERAGALTRAAELRSLCLQQRAEEAVGMMDTSGAAELLRPVFDRIASMFDSEAGEAAPQPAPPPPPLPAPALGGGGGGGGARLSPAEGVFGASNVLRPADEAAARGEAAELDQLVRGGGGAERPLERVRRVLSDLGSGDTPLPASAAE